MTKAEMIERYGIEWYEEHKRKSAESHRTKEFTEYCRKFHAERYKDPANRKHRNAQNCEYIKTRVCKEYWKVENYELAKADNFDPNKWHLHHRLENYWSRSKLIRKNLYINVNPESLIWLPAKEHMTDSSISIHHKERSKWHKRILEE